MKPTGMKVIILGAASIPDQEWSAPAGGFRVDGDGDLTVEIPEWQGRRIHAVFARGQWSAVHLYEYLEK